MRGWGDKRLGPGSVLRFEGPEEHMGRGCKGKEEERVTEGGRRGVMTQVKSRESDGEEDRGCRAGRASTGIWTWSVYSNLSAEGHTKSLTNNTITGLHCCC